MLISTVLFLFICFLTDAVDAAAMMSRIVGLHKNATKPYSYLALILTYQGNSPNTGICGGCIISKEWILTAAHCIYGSQVSHVLIKFNKLNLVDREPKEIVVKVPKKGNFFIHEGYVGVNYRIVNDIALIRMPKPIKLGSSLSAANLPTKSTNTDNQKATLAGWGATKVTIPYNPSLHLQYADMQIISNKQCKKNALDKYNYGYSAIFNTTTYLCTSSTLSMFCKGDSGSPLVINNPKPTIVGIVSHHIEDWCTRGMPDIYTRVSSFLEWIKQKQKTAGTPPKTEEKEGSSSKKSRKSVPIKNKNSRMLAEEKKGGSVSKKNRKSESIKSKNRRNNPKNKKDKLI